MNITITIITTAQESGDPLLDLIVGEGDQRRRHVKIPPRGSRSGRRRLEFDKGTATPEPIGKIGKVGTPCRISYAFRRISYSPLSVTRLAALSASEDVRLTRPGPFPSSPATSMTDDRLMLLMFIASVTVAAGAVIMLLWLHL
jgi:hypothetical protein